MTLMLVPGTLLHREWEAGAFVLPDAYRAAYSHRKPERSQQVPLSHQPRLQLSCLMAHASRRQDLPIVNFGGCHRPGPCRFHARTLAWAVNDRRIIPGLKPIKAMRTYIIGVDSATDPKKVGLAFGVYEDGNAHLVGGSGGISKSHILDTVENWLAGNPTGLIAIDAPLGWPADLGEALHNHEAGDPILVEPNLLFRRATDKFIKNAVGKQPLDVGADRIARTAHSALRFLNDTRERCAQPIPLAWEPGQSNGFSSIEVYPAATLIAHGVTVAGYKRKGGLEARRKILDEMRTYMRFPADVSLLETNEHVLDAAICVWAGVDFLLGDVYKPVDINLAMKEGWIWVRKL